MSRSTDLKLLAHSIREGKMTEAECQERDLDALVDALDELDATSIEMLLEATGGRSPKAKASAECLREIIEGKDNQTGSETTVRCHFLNWYGSRGSLKIKIDALRKVSAFSLAKEVTTSCQAIEKRNRAKSYFKWRKKAEPSGSVKAGCALTILGPEGHKVFIGPPINQMVSSIITREETKRRSKSLGSKERQITKQI